jgi:hypothetical protein
VPNKTFISLLRLAAALFANMRYISSKQFLVRFVLLIYVCIPPAFADKQSYQRVLEGALLQGPVNMVMPIFSQVVRVPMTAPFMQIDEKVNDPFYIWKAVLPGESIQKWSQMFTVSGFKAMSNAPPELVARMFAEALKQTCPDTFSVKSMDTSRLKGNRTAGLLLACGTASSIAEHYSDTRLLIAMQGQSDFYVFQWAELGPASRTPIEFDIWSVPSGWPATRVCWPLIPTEMAALMQASCSR